MKYTVTSILAFLIILNNPFSSYAQTRPKNLMRQADLFRNFMGYKNSKGEVLLDGEGYSILFTGYKMKPDEHNFAKVGDNLEGKNKVILKKLNGSPLENYVLDGSQPDAKPPYSSLDFLYPGKSSDIIDVNIMTYGKLDIAKVKQIVASVYYDGIYDSILIDPSKRMVDFVGHKMEFVDGCAWLKPHMIQTGKGSSITWNTYNTLAQAENAKNQELKLAMEYAGDKKLDTTKAQVVFEGKDVTADKLLFDKDFMGVTLKNGRTANVYYIAAEIRGRYVFCRIAYPIDELTVPFMITRVMKVR